MKEDKDTRVVEVFTGSPWEAEFIKGLLESNGIESILKDCNVVQLFRIFNTEVGSQLWHLTTSDRK